VFQLEDIRTSAELGKFCGPQTPDPVYTTSNQLRITFHSDSSISGQGFLINWQAVSSTAVTPPAANATNPPGRLQHNPGQRWNRVSGSRVTVSPGQRFWPGRIGSWVSVSDPMFDPVLSFVLTCAFIVAFFLQSNTISAN